MKLRYTDEEILADHPFAAPHVVAGYRLHGGFDEEGNYLPPRTLHRPEAVSHWRESLTSGGGEPLAIGLELLEGPRYPNFAQQKLLLERGQSETLWNSLTNIGRTEARGAMIALIEPPSFAGVLQDDVASMTAGHLKPLFVAHGADEGGIPAEGIGGHDQMWFAARDLAFGPGRHPLPPVLQPNRPGTGQGTRWLPDLPAAHAELLRMLIGLLLIEIRAFIGFEQNERLLRDPDLFQDRRAEADCAADIIARIRVDEGVHVDYLCALFGEIRSTPIRCVDGSEKPGHEVFDPAWEKQVHLSSVVFPRAQREEMRKAIHARVAPRPGGAEILEEFESLSDPGAFDS